MTYYFKLGVLFKHIFKAFIVKLPERIVKHERGHCRFVYQLHYRKAQADICRAFRTCAQVVDTLCFYIVGKYRIAKRSDVICYL